MRVGARSTRRCARCCRSSGGLRISSGTPGFFVPWICPRTGVSGVDGIARGQARRVDGSLSELPAARTLSRGMAAIRVSRLRCERNPIPAGGTAVEATIRMREFRPSLRTALSSRCVAALGATALVSSASGKSGTLSDRRGRAGRDPRRLQGACLGFGAERAFLLASGLSGSAASAESGARSYRSTRKRPPRRFAASSVTGAWPTRSRTSCSGPTCRTTRS